MRKLSIDDERDLPYIKIYYCDTNISIGNKEIITDTTFPETRGYGHTVRNHYIMHYISQGKGIFYLAGKAHPVHSGQIIITPPFYPIAYTVELGESWHNYSICFAGGESDNLVKNSRCFFKSPVYSVNPSIARVYFENIVVNFKKDPSNRLDIIGDLYHIFSLITPRNEVIPPDNYTNPYVQKAINIIRLNYSSPIIIGKLADDLNVERTYLYRLFIEETGVSPKQYLSDYRLAVAFEILPYSRDSIEAVAQSVGYASTSTFTKAFKTKYGMTPTKYASKKKDYLQTIQKSK